MRFFLCLIVTLVALVMCHSKSSEKSELKNKLYNAKEGHLRYMWKEFMRSYNKQYSSPAIEESRFNYFVNNLKLADARNLAELEKGGTAVHGITKFFDNDEKEFQTYFLGSKSSFKPSETNNTLKTVAPATKAALRDGEFVNWAGILTTPVKNQGYCGSCWAFSATEQIESDSMRTLGTDYILSPEQIVQCAPIAQGCSGGWTEVAYSYVHAAGGIEQDSAYPYSSFYGVTGTCAVVPSAEVIAVKGYTKITGETDMANYVLSTGPLSVCLDASTWNTYTGGIMSVCGNQVDHCVQSVGVNTASEGGYWIVRNSWGTDWGEDGYIYLAFGANTCDITNDPTWTSVAVV